MYMFINLPEMKYVYTFKWDILLFPPKTLNDVMFTSSVTRGSGMISRGFISLALHLRIMSPFRIVFIFLYGQ